MRTSPVFFGSQTNSYLHTKKWAFWQTTNGSGINELINSPGWVALSHWHINSRHWAVSDWYESPRMTQWYSVPRVFLGWANFLNLSSMVGRNHCILLFTSQFGVGQNLLGGSGANIWIHPPAVFLLFLLKGKWSQPLLNYTCLIVRNRKYRKNPISPCLKLNQFLSSFV